MNIRTGNQAISTGDNTTRFASVTKDNMTFSGLYLRLLDAIGAGGTTYFSYWNVQWKSDMLGRGTDINSSSTAKPQLVCAYLTSWASALKKANLQN